MPEREWVRGLGPLRPTYARELLLGRKYADLPHLLGLAFREHRREKGMSQRSYADVRGWSKGRQWRLESTAGELRLQVLLEALDGTGFTLGLIRTKTTDLSLAPGQLSGEWTLWLDSEFVARDEADRRFPPHRRVRRTIRPPWWWWRLYSTSRCFGPEWTTEE
ncbi:MAG: hypothetical protein WA966_12165 [Ornithinimicrobium sp.]